MLPSASWLPSLINELVPLGNVSHKYCNIFDECSYCFSTNVNELAARIAAEEPLVTPNVIPQLVDSLRKLQNKLNDAGNHLYHKHRILKTHLLPLTNVGFDKKGERYVSLLFPTTCLKQYLIIHY